MIARDDAVQVAHDRVIDSLSVLAEVPTDGSVGGVLEDHAVGLKAATDELTGLLAKPAVLRVHERLPLGGKNAGDFGLAASLHERLHELAWATAELSGLLGLEQTTEDTTLIARGRGGS